MGATLTYDPTANEASRYLLCLCSRFDFYTSDRVCSLTRLVWSPSSQSSESWFTFRTGLPTNGAFPLHGTARYGTVRFTFGGFSTGYCT